MNAFRTMLRIGGVLLIAAAALLTSAGIEYALRGSATGALAWGPTLFRVLLVVHGIALLIFSMRKRVASAAAALESHETPPRGFAPWFMLIALLAAALALRLWRLDTCLWYDEVITLVDFIRPPFGSILTSFPNQNQHMLYSLLAHACTALFGEGAAAARLPSVAFGVGSIAALFLLGRSLLTMREALLACGLMTFSYHHVWFSQSARGYMGLLFFATLAVWLWIEARRRGGAAWWTAYVLAITLGLWIHMTMVFLLAAHSLLYLISLAQRRSRPLRRPLEPLIAWFFCGTLTLQLYALALPEFLASALHEESRPGTWTSPLWLLAESLRSFHFGPLVLAVAAAGGLVFLAGAVDLMKRRPAAVVQMLLPPALGGVAMLVLAHNLWPRFFFFAIGFALLIAVHGLDLTSRLAAAVLTSPSRRERLTAVTSAAIGLLLIAGSATTLPRCYAPPKQDFTGARDFVDSHRRPGEEVAAVGLAGRAYETYYAPHWSHPRNAEALAQLERQSPSMWLVFTLPVHLQTYEPDIWKAKNTRFRPIKTFPGTLGGGDLIVCRRVPPSEAR